MSLANKFGIPQGLLDAAKKALDEANEYQKKVQAHMAKKGIKSLNDLTPDQKKKFFNDLDAMHTAKNEEVESVEEGSGPKEKQKTPYRDINSPASRAAADKQREEMDKEEKSKKGKKLLDKIAAKNEEVELTQEDLDFIASLNQIDEISIKTAVKAHEKMALDNNPEKNRTGSAGDQSDRMLKKMKTKWGDKAVKKAQVKYQGTNENFDLDDFIASLNEMQIDELSNSTLERYVRAKERRTNFNPKVKDRFQMKKAAARVAARDDGETHATHPVPKAYHDQHAAYKKDRDELEKKHSEKIDKVRGDESASKKQVKKTEKAIAALKKKHGVTASEDFDLDDFSLEDIQEYMQTEEFSQLDELSKETLGSYIKKRQHDVAAQGAITRQHAVDAEKAKKDNNYSQQRKSNEKSDKAFAKGWKYRQNISKAVDKIVNKA